jgi:hypothetical protein
MQTLVERLQARAKIRREITTRKSVQEGKPDRIADLLEEAAKEITKMNDETLRYLASYLIDNSEKFAYLRIKFGMMGNEDIALDYDALMTCIKEFFNTLP